MTQEVRPEASQQSIRHAVGHALKPPILLRGVFTSAIIWLLMASAMPSYAGLIFHGELAGYFATGLAIVLVSEIVMVVITALLSSGSCDSGGAAEPDGGDSGFDRRQRGQGYAARYAAGGAVYDGLPGDCGVVGGCRGASWRCWASRALAA